MPFNLLLLLVLSFSYLDIIQLSNDVLSNIYLPLAFISQISLMVFLIFLLTLPLLFLRKFGIFIIITIYTILIFFLFLDTLVFQQYRFHINAFVIELIINGGGDIFNFSWITWLKTIGFLIFVLSIEVIGSVILWRWTRIKHYWGYINTLFIILSILISQTIHAWSYVYSYTPVLKLTPVLPYYYPVISQELVDYFNFPVYKSDNQKIKKYQGRLNYPKKPLQCVAKSKQNIVFIVVDTLRFDMLNAKTMPNTTAFAKQNIIFNNHLSGGHGTRTGIFALMTGIPSIYWDDFLQTKTSSVFIETLQKNNYKLNILASAKLTSPAFDKTIFAKVKNLRTHTKGNGSAEKDIQITKEFIDFIDNRDKSKPFFTFLFYDAVHGYNTPKNFKKPFLPELSKIDYFKLNNSYDPTTLINRYKNSVYFVDGLIAKVIAKLKADDEYENTIIVITADHGQEFNDNKLNYWGHSSNFSKYQLQIPMVLKMHNQTKIINRRTTSLDVVPTIMQEVLNCKNEISDYSLGFNLFDTKKRDFLISGVKTHYGVITDDLIVVDRNINVLLSYDLNYRPSNKKLPIDIYKKVVRDLSWFYH
ncbi:Choline-sulfatase [hydrothermal vent metagenome]|uniref:Choline-sulfatase n=1 Tax=hydrothermal vent metagenome TaxID=652676 RepID=A0A1W1CTT1_9ZZZZ